MIKQKFVLGLLSFILICSGIPVFHAAHAQLVISREIVFPVVGAVSYSDDFGDPRSNGGTHEGNDIMGKKMMPLIAAVDGTISNVEYPEATWGYSISIRDKDGYQYWYLHMNNDTPGTDNDKGDGFFAYAPDVQEGNPVVKGQLIGWMGDSGNAEATSPHLHFEIHAPTGEPFDPYLSLKGSTRIVAPITDYPPLRGEILPYANFTGGMSVASGNFDSDSNIEVVTAAGAGGGPLVRVFEKDSTGTTSLASFYAYDESFRGGADVAAGDVNGDGISEIITVPGFGGGPHVRIFKADGTLFKEFMAYDSNFHGGLHISTADMDGDGKAEIITAPGVGGGPHIKVFSQDGILVKEFMAYDSNFHGGIDVAGFSKTANSAGGIVTAPQAGGGPHIKIFDPATGLMTREFMAYDPVFHGGVRVSAQSATTGSNSGPRITTMPASGGGPNLKIFALDGTETSSSMTAFEPWWQGGYDVAAASDSTIFIASGPGRRASLRTNAVNLNNGNNFYPNQFNNSTSTSPNIDRRRYRIPQGD